VTPAPPPSPDVALARARQALVEARDNLKLGHTSLAVSRAYYATLFASLALLKSIGVEAKTHDGVQTAIALHFVKPGKLSAGTSRRLKHLEGDREIADYDFVTVMTEADATSTIAEAEAYVTEAAALLGA
jgi:uncharacterized protein (UPF0332 family)